MNENQIENIFEQNRELQRAKKKAESSERKLKSVLRITRVGSWYIDTATNEVTWSKELYKMYGFNPDLPAPSFTKQHQLFAPDSWKALSSAVTAIRKTGIPFEIELKTVRENGSNGWIWARGEIAIDKDHKNIGLWGAAQDISERKKLELDLIISKEKYAAAIDLLNKELDFQIEEKDRLENELSIAYNTISDYKYALDESSIIAITDQKGIIHTVNDNFCNISKYSREELVGQDHRIISSGYHSKEFFKELWSTIANGKVWKGELKNKAKDGTIYWLDTIIVPFLTPEGIPYQYIAIRTEITNRKRADEHLKAINKELDAFSYSVSHDLRAPLRAINGYAKILEEDYDTVLDSEGKRLLNVVRANSIKMGVLIDDLLTFSRLGRRKMTKSSVNMNKMVETYLSEINHTPGHGAEIKFNQLLPVRGDNNLLRHVITNLLSNAIKYSSKKENPLIEIKSERKNGMLTYSVKDNGVGFDMHYKDKLFEVFQRLHADDEFSGNGVGLAIVQRIIQKHEGKVWAEGKEGHGATFFFSMPDI
jgi:PAS domain S-box-containing protein